ncbi:hypothetical protein N431DRAFT_490660 [Stipitochalara longipes BDJ]|nr:hypothetical protein N431DRAFT_490660 [Stipitochalara longipes BDJ]
MSSLHPLDSANRPLSIDRPLIQYPQPNSSMGENPVARSSGQASLQSFETHLSYLSNIATKTEDLMKKKTERGSAANGEEDETTTLLPICAMLRSIDQRLHKGEAALIRYQYVADSIDKPFDYDEDTLSPLYDPILDMAPAMANNYKILLDNMQQFHDRDMDQHATQEATLDSIYREQIDRWDEFSKQLKCFHKRKVQTEEHETVMEKLEDVRENQMDMENTLVDKLQEIHNRQDVKEQNLVVKLNDMNKNQTGFENNLMAKLNETQQQLADANAYHTKRSILMYAAQEQILDRVSSKIDTLDARCANVSGHGDDAVNGASLELQAFRFSNQLSPTRVAP